MVFIIMEKTSEKLEEPKPSTKRVLAVQVNTVKVFAEVLLWDVEICRRTVLDKKWCKDQTLDLPTLMCSIRLAPVYPGRTKH